ncbi:acetyltransferase, partial [Aeromonas taiwanensis]
MLSLLPGPLVLLISTGLTILFTALCASLILLVSLAKLLLSVPAFGRACSRLNNRFMRLWLGCNALVIRLTTRIDWQVEDDTRLRKDGWYLIISNHLSWTDIVVLGHLFRDRLPVPKFFMKHELIYIPLLGLACWGLDMPFMRRYSREFLLRNPHLRGKDIETTRNACEKFRHIPTTVINFVEGTRFTEAKRDASRSRFRHL